jgi:predicted membrane-bound mannosyltransferase
MHTSGRKIPESTSAGWRTDELDGQGSYPAEPTHGPFLLHVLNAIVYPDLPEWPVVGVAVVCVAILGVYLRRYLSRRADDMR